MSAVTAGYPGFHASNPYMLPLLLEATTNCVENFCQVQRGENVLIIGEFDTDPYVVSAFASSARLAGGDVSIITTSPFSAGGWIRGGPSDIVVGAFERSDVVISCSYFEFAHNEKTFFNKIFSGKYRVCSILTGASPGCLISAGRFPLPLFSEIGRRAHDILQKTKKIRITTSSGTDILFEDPTGIRYSGAIKAGSWDNFPPMGINNYPSVSNGVVIFDESTITGKPSSPIKLTIENNFVTKIEGGSQAETNAIESFANGRYAVRHLMIGLNPKARTVNAPQFERARAAGTAHLGIDGTGSSGVLDRTKPGFSHFDMILDTPTIWVDDRLFVENRRLLILEDKELQGIAEKYGDPRKVLAQNPFLW
jgi:2,5-dihydroxypyridine 5,6-dioxygenase